MFEGRGCIQFIVFSVFVFVSFNKKYNNAQGGYRVASDPSGSSARAGHNGAHQEQPLSGI